jgi:F420-non-reducing hydrogenase small subunit
MNERPRLAIYWASSCGGCEVAVANLHERFLDLAERFELFFCPCLLDTKRAEVEALPDGALAVTLFNGSIRTDENAEMARLLRRKTQTLVAFGACAHTGGVPALSNLSSRREHFDTIFGPAGGREDEDARPREETRAPEGVLRLPGFHDRVRSLAQVVEVDYFVPGCPPESDQVWNAIEALAGEGPRPARGAVLGAGASSVCDECPRTREDKLLRGVRRLWEFEPDSERCLVDQGLICMGLATRGGCRALCPAVNMPCSGCYGPPEGVYDQGAKLVAALGSILDVSGLRGLRNPEEIAARVDRVLDGLPDVAGTGAKYSLAGCATPRGGREP